MPLSDREMKERYPTHVKFSGGPLGGRRLRLWIYAPTDKHGLPPRIEPFEPMMKRREHEAFFEERERERIITFNVNNPGKYGEPWSLYTFRNGRMEFDPPSIS